MRYSVVFSSRTGNTARLAERVREALPGLECTYFGEPNQAANTDVVFVGFWTDKGSCDAASATFLSEIRGKQIFLFGTAGFGGSKEYFDKILATAINRLDGSNSVIGSFMAQGKMPNSVRERYTRMLTGGEGDSKIQEMIENFDRASDHPNIDDLNSLEVSVHNAINSIQEDV